MKKAEFVKYMADNHIQFTLPEDNRKYPYQKCQDDEINNAFKELHENLVNEVISFCNKWGVKIDEVYLHADGLEESCKFGCWQPCTDSTLRFDKFEKDNNGIYYEYEPFLLNF